MRSEIKTKPLPIQAPCQVLACKDLPNPCELSPLQRKVFLQPGRYMIRSGESPRGIFIHRRGLVQRISPYRIDNCLASEKAETHCVYGLTETLSGINFNFSIKSVTPAEFDVVDRDDILDFIRDRPEVIGRLNLIFSNLYRNAVSRLTERGEKRI